MTPQCPRRRSSSIRPTLLAGGSLAVALSLMLPTGARAEDRYWDANGTGVGSGGSGTWNLSNLNWSPNGDGVSGPFVEPWDNGGLDNAIFGGAAGTVTLGGPVTVDNITFSSAGYVLNGSTLTLGGPGATITANAGDTTINSAIAGSNGLTKAGNGSLILNGANSFAGDIRLNAGSLYAAQDAALGAVGNNILTAAGASVRLSIGGAGSARTVTIGDGGTLNLEGTGGGALRIRGNGSVSVAPRDVTLSNDMSDYTGRTTFVGCNGVCTTSFTSIGNLGEASSLGAPVTVADGTIVFNQSSQYSDNVVYLGSGDSSNRNWDINGNAAYIRNRGSGTLEITGDIDVSSRAFFTAETADVHLLGVLSGGDYVFEASAGRFVRLGMANSFTGAAQLTGEVRLGKLADTGSASSLGTGSIINLNAGSLSYSGSGDTSNRDWLVNGANAIRNDGSGALHLSGALVFDSSNPNPDRLTLGGSFGGSNIFAGPISGDGDLVMDGVGTWVLSGANSQKGLVTVNNGTLRAGAAGAFGAATGFVMNGGRLDLGGFALTASSLSGNAGVVDVSGTTLTVKAATAQIFGGHLTGNGGLTKEGAGTLTLTSANSYTGTTTVAGGKLALDFSGSGGAVSDIIASASQLALSGGIVELLGAGGEANSQAFSGVSVNAGNNIVRAIEGSGGSISVHLGAISRTGGLVNFVLPGSGAFTTSNADGRLGGWATINGADYAKVAGGEIVALDAADYAYKDDAQNWVTGDIVSDAGGAANSPFFGTVNSDLTLDGLLYSAAANSAVTIDPAATLGIDGTIIVAPSTGSANQTLTGGQVTSGPAGGTVGIQHNGGGTFTLSSSIVDSGGTTAFVKGGAGRLHLGNANSYTGSTTLSGGTLRIGRVENGGVASSLGASSAASDNLVLESGILEYTGGSVSSDRGFTLVNGGAMRTIHVSSAAADLMFSGLVTSPDDAGFTKAGAGTLTLAHAANDYIGATAITGGTLAVNVLGDGGSASGIGAASSASSNLILRDGGQLRYLGATTSSDRGFTLANGQGQIDVAAAGTTLTLSGVATGAGSLVKNGEGRLILSGANDFTGDTIINAGVLQAGSANAFGPLRRYMTINSGATLDLGGYDISLASIIGGGTVDLGGQTLTTAGGPGTFTGRITGSGGFTRMGGYTQVFTGCGNDYTGVTTIAGALSIDCIANGGQASGIGASSADSANLVMAGGGLFYQGASASTDRGMIFTAASTLSVVDPAATLEFSGAVVNNRQLRKQGAGTLLLSGNNVDLTGSLRIMDGTLRAGSTNSFGTGWITFDDVAGTTLDLGGFDNSVGYLTGGGAFGGNVRLDGATLTIAVGSTFAGANYAGVISGNGGLVKDGNRIQQLSGCASSYDGPTIISGGTLAVACLDNGGTLSSIGASSADAANLVLNGGTLQYIGAGGSTDRRFTLGASASSKIEASGTGAIAFTDSGDIAFAAPDTAQTLTLGGTNSDNNILAGRITNNGAGVTRLTKTDQGTWVLINSDSSYTGITTISGGVLAVDKLANGGLVSSIGASSAAASNLVIGNGSTLRYTGAGDTTDRLFTLSAGVTFIESSGTGAIVFTDTGPVTLAGNNQARTIALGGTNMGQNRLAGSIGNAGTGVTSLAKNDSGTWVLTGNNSYSGSTNINGGTLFIGGGGTSGSIVSATVNNFGTLGFNRSNSLTYTGQIVGTGALLQAGSGTTILTGSNSYSGGTTISGGTLQLGNGGASGSIVGDVVNNGQLRFNRNNDYNFTGLISGSGAVVQAGSGTTILTGANSYAGGTTVSGGVLRVASDGNLGAASGGLSFDGGTLNTTGSFASARAVNLVGAGGIATDAGTALTLNGVVTGAGHLTKSGDGALILAGDNDYAGGTTIAAGILQVGNGGAAGSVAGDILNNGSLLFNRDGTLDGLGTISGTGSVTQAGPGTTILTGANSYDGATSVNAGRLLINGDQSAATGLTNVASGAALGGTGIIGGSVVIADGASLAAGSDGVGTLTINGNLALGNTSQLGFEFGQANVPGGPLNDLINVGGDLTLDGVVNVSVPAGGSFGPGIYRMFNYAGALTDKGLVLGTMPAGSDAFVQTVVPGQVNLANAAGLTLNFWDGAGQPKNDSVIQGGDGFWRLNDGMNNWTDGGGGVNADYAQDSFVIFQGTGGTVTIDNGGGNILSSGMQFASDNYVITGDALTLTGGEAFIRVGDGGAADIGLSATIAAEVTGAARLVKTDGGRLILSAVNSYTGGTAVNGGTLVVSADANLGAATGALSFDGGTLHSIASFASTRVVDLAGSGTFQADGGTLLALSGAMGGAGALTKKGAGTLQILTDASYGGGTTIDEGTLRLGNGGASGSIVGDIVNHGTLHVDRGNAWTFAGTISGSGALFKDGTGTMTLTADSSYTDGTTISMGELRLGDGGTAGSIVGDVVNDGTLSFHRADAIAFAGLVSGTGSLVQMGAGTTQLAANNSYAGATRVEAGTLLINGDQSGAAGLTSVSSAATLGGTGVIGGDVILADGAALAPGADGPGTLAIKGSLSLSGGSALQYDFGQSAVVGGPLNDLVTVDGDLVLDGTIHVTDSGGGSFAPGLYRAINYGGTLTNNGLVLGTVPPGTDFYVQTSVANQVNLINTDGLALRFWDGAAGGRNDGAITGGDGIWQNASGNDNWTLADGAINAPFLDNAFAVFSGVSGTVSVDNSLDATRATGMQFAVDGYRLTGDDLTLTGAEVLVRVGDGTAAGVGYGAVIANALAGDSKLVKADLGTLTLSGANSYTGGTRIDAGTLRISSDSNLGDAAGGLSLNGGRLHTTADLHSNRAVELAGSGAFHTDTGTILTLAGNMAGAGGFTKSGDGDLILSGTGDFGGDVAVTGGRLFVNGDQSAATGHYTVGSGTTLGGVGVIGGDVAVADGARLSAGVDDVGTLTINGSLTLSGASRLDYAFGAANVAGGALNDLVTVGGDLMLDGVIDVSIPAGGSFGPGVYRIFDYAGALTDKGLALGTMPTGSSMSVQTSINGQVNLVNSAGLTLSFWDGAAGPKNDGIIQGGDGIWRAGGGSDNWTDMTGTPNADYAQGSFAIFQGTGGNVLVDNSGGDILASGLQFASDGYVVEGDGLTLTAPDAIVQVGDGSVAGASYTATISSAITGTSRLVKTDAGTLILTGVNSYTGGTAIHGGIVRVAADENLGMAAGGLSLNGGTLHSVADMTSDRSVDLAGTGVFLTDDGTTLTLTGAATGPGALVKRGNGTLILGGNGQYAGGTQVAQGLLLVNGDHGAATGDMRVNGGGRLGGTGIIGGNVMLDDGAVLTPGAGGAGTLTINGDLSLSAGTLLAYDLGAANVAGGALNDLVHVGGDLTLDGRLDVTVSAGGAFDVGVYRLFNYTGALTDNGLTLGSLPAGGNMAVQTSIAGQVNLVNSAGLTLRFWDGAAGPKNDSVLNGGDGIWQNGLGNDNWTDASGALNAAYSDGAFAIFGGAPGTVTVDSSLGQVLAAGMQFTVDGYRIAGDAITLTLEDSIIRVGDGSSAGAELTATIDAALSGDARLIKTDAGKLVLTGTNSYSGGTVIQGGTLEIGADTHLGAADGALSFEDGTLAIRADMASERDFIVSGTGTLTTANDTLFRYDGLLSGSGALTKAGGGTLVMTSDNSGFDGSMTVSSGTLVASGLLGGTLRVDTAGRLEGTGSVGDLTNAGIVAPGDDSFGTLTVGGNYAGAGGSLEIEVALGGDESQSDRLHIMGSASGTTQIDVINRGGLGAQTIEGIKIVELSGDSAADSFTLKGDYLIEGSPAVIAGAYGYRLYQGGVSTPADGDWYLRSALLNGKNEPQGPLYQPGVPVYEGYTATLQMLNQLGTLQQRVGNRQWSGFTRGGIGMWGRMDSGRDRSDALFSTSKTSLQADNWSLQAGLDKALLDISAGTLIAGVNASYGEADGRSRSAFGDGAINARGLGLGATLTWYDATGFYADAQGRASWYRSDLDSAIIGKLADNNRGSGEAFSLEMGKRAALGHGIAVTPQVQMSYSNVRFDSFVDPHEAVATARKGDSLKSRWGLALDYQSSEAVEEGAGKTHLYGVVNLSYEWLEGTAVDVSGILLERRTDRLWGSFGLGGSHAWDDGRFTLYTELTAHSAVRNFGDSYRLSGTAGFRMAF
ncbi:autotransporter-associated beta strand repeat-containing protein [Sphingopyxis sp. MWB1]|uniref:autotransporter-associated beta strand repeat-containing protein n=1 Tax=Sphingopyxis sp. MWB1 TaxID=1537715 RepID=UPI00068FA9F4|nr:autotransporter-associated beta strand repeat-containing protein [Sphingopyxis sp. MWB1]